MNLNTIIALEEAAPAASGGLFGSQSLIYIGLLVVMVVVFYFVIIRPQKKQEKETNAMRNSLRVGDEVTTIGGIIGKIVSIKDPTCIIETGRDGTRIRILKTAIKTVDVPASAVLVDENAEGDAAQTEETASADESTAAPEESKKDKKKKKKEK